MTFNQSLNKYWNYLERKYNPPKYVGRVKTLEFKDLKSAIDNKNLDFIKNIIKKMYVNKEAYILKNSASKKLKTTIIDLANHYTKNRKKCFYKTLNGVPNFHRIIDKNITKKYSVYAIKHSFYFYNWNIKTKLEKKLKNGVYRHWRYIKNLAGNSK